MAFLFFLCQSCLIPLSVAQEATLSYEKYGVEDGLSNRQVNAIFQDQEGFLWAGTEYGLNRFDGYRFEWRTKEKNGLFSNEISQITEDAAGFLWVFYQYAHQNRRHFHINHIDLLSPQTRTLISFEEEFGTELPFDLMDVYADCRVRGPDQTMYLGASDTARLIRYHPDSGFQVSLLDGYGSFFVLARATDGSIWGIADHHSLVQTDFNGNILRELSYERRLHPNRIAFDSRFLWIQLSGENQPAEFQKVDTENGAIIPLSARDFQLPDHLAYNGYYQLRYDAVNELVWGISLFPYTAAIPVKEGSFLTHIHQLLPDYAVKGNFGARGFWVDKAGQVWMGGNFGLFCVVLARNRFSNFLNSPDLSDPKALIACRSMLKIEDHLLVTTDEHGLYKIDLVNRQLAQLRIPEKFTYDGSGKVHAFAIIKGDGPEIWTAKYNFHHINLENGQSRLIENERKVDFSLIWTLYMDRRERIWGGTEYGLAYMDPAEKILRPFTDYGPFEELARARVISFVEDESGFLWICTNRGLYLLDPEQGITGRFWTGGSGKYRLPHDDIRHIYQDEAGIYWLASGGGGLIRWDRQQKKYQQFTRADGLSNNILYAVYEDKRRHLWLSSDFGIIQFDKNTFQTNTYLEQDGISHNEFNRTSHYQDSAGHIYFGGLNGVTSFDPEDFYHNDKRQNAPLVITGFQQFLGRQNQLVDRMEDLLKSKEIILRPSDRFFNLSFALLSFYKPEQIRYAYQIVGWDKNWNYRREGSLRLGQLPYGRLTPEGGEVLVSLSRRQLAIDGSIENPSTSYRFLSTGDQLWLTVKDTGTGISEHQLPHIFDRFYQADSSIIKRGEGSGIGLALTS